MGEPAHNRLSILACRLLRVSRSSCYYVPVPKTDEMLAHIAVIDETFMDCHGTATARWRGTSPRRL